jgi:hypothetical protein
MRRVFAVIVGLGLLIVLPVGAAESGLRVAEFRVAPSGLVLKVVWSSEFTHRLDIYCCSNLVAGDWSCQAAALDPAGADSLIWLAPLPPASNACFYLVGDHDLDTDLDGLSDAGEMLVHHTDPLQSDSDRDGLSDGDEIRRGTNPLDPASRLAVLYADSDSGNDSNDGWAPVPAGGHGPKRSMAAALAAACSGDQVVMGGTAGFAEPMPGLGGKSVRLYPEGSITWRP